MSLLKHNRVTGMLTILAGIFALACVIIGAVAVDYHFEVFNDPSLMLTLPGVSATAAKWSMIFDMFGYYILLLPFIYYLHDWMKDKTPWSNLLTFCGLAYVLIGAIGASILAVVWPYTIHAYAAATPEAQQIIKQNFEFVNTMVYGGLWNLLEMVFAATWWLASGILLLKAKHKGVAITAIITGSCCLLDGISGMISNAMLHEISLNAYLYISIVWTIWTGIALYRKPFIEKNSTKITT